MQGGMLAPAPPFPNSAGSDRALGMQQGAPFNAPGSAPQGNVPGTSATLAASPPSHPSPGGIHKMMPTAPAPFPTGGGSGSLGQEQDEQTMVGQPSADLIAATGSRAANNDPAGEWHQVYEEFVRTKRECNEPTDGLTFEKFQQTLKKNRDALMQRHGCKRVKFSVYVKEGRASLKATPVRE